MCVGREWYFTSRPLPNTSYRCHWLANTGSWGGWQQGAPSRNLWSLNEEWWSWEPLHLALVGSSQALWQWPLQGQSFSTHLPKMLSAFKGCNALWGQGWLYSTCIGVHRRTSHPGVLQDAEMWQVGGKLQNPRRHQSLALKFLGFRVVTFLCDLRPPSERSIKSELQELSGKSRYIWLLPELGSLCCGNRDWVALSTSNSSKDNHWHWNFPWQVLVQRTKYTEARELS